MAETQNQGDKARKPRPFGSFLLFLTVIVVVLVAFGGSQLKKTEDLTQDEFLHQLVTGRIQRLDLKGMNEVEGVLENGKFFRTSVASLAENEADWREMKAKARYTSEQADTVIDAVRDETFLPSEIWQVTEVSVEPTPKPSRDEGAEATPPRRLARASTTDSSSSARPLPTPASAAPAGPSARRRTASAATTRSRSRSRTSRRG